MAKILCEICGKSISTTFDFYEILDKDDPDKKICERCARQKKILLTPLVSDESKENAKKILFSYDYNKELVGEYVKKWNDIRDVQEERASEQLTKDAERLKRHQEEKARIALEQIELNAGYYDRLDNMILSSTPTLEGYSIEKYIGLVSGEYTIGTGMITELAAAVADFWGSSSYGYSSKLGRAKDEAVKNMAKNAARIGATAVVGIDIDILTVGANMFIACANGTAVIVKANSKTDAKD